MFPRNQFAILVDEEISDLFLIELIPLLLKLIFGTDEVGTVVAPDTRYMTTPAQKASQRVYERIGRHFVRNFEVDRFRR